MRLRTVLHRPNRYEEEHDSSASRNMPSHQSKINKSTIPAYPELLLRSATVDTRQVRPAAFPSLPLTGRRGSTKQIFQSTGESTDTIPPWRSQLFDPTRNRPFLPHPDAHSMKSWTEAREQKDKQVGSDKLVQKDLGTYATLSAPKPTPISTSDTTTDSKLAWNEIEPGLQLYIFDSLILQFKLPEFVGEVLGLAPTELMHLVALRHQRALQPRSTEQLWNFCRGIGDGTKPYIEPAILKGYLDYFAYVSLFENASIAARHAAVALLRDRKIEGAFVDALLPDQPGIWTYPVSSKRDHEATQLSTITSDNEVERESLLSSAQVHDSHDLDMVVDHLRSSYFPSTVRKALFAKPLQDLDAFERWLMYGEMLPTAESAKAITNHLLQHSSKSRTALNSMLHVLSHVFDKGKPQGVDGETLENQSDRVHVMLYYMTQNVRQLRLLGQRLSRTPLDREQKEIVYKVARQRTESEFKEKMRGLATATADNGVSTASPSGIANTDLPTVSAETVTLASLPKHNNSSDHTTILLSHERDVGHSSATTSESDRRHRGRNGDDKSTNQNAIMSADGVALRALTQMINVSPDRAPSQDSYHTAPNFDNDREVVSRSQQHATRSPSPPPWSPITEADTEMPDIGILPDHVSAQAAAQHDELHGKSIAPQRSTPWKGNITTSQRAPTKSDQGNVQAADVHRAALDNHLEEPEVLQSKVFASDVSQPLASTDAATADKAKPIVTESVRPAQEITITKSQSQPEILSGIREAATLLLSSPPSSPSVDQLALNASPRPAPKFKRLSPMPKEATNHPVTTPQPQKKKQLSLQGEEQKQPQERNTKLALSIRIPPPSASSTPAPSNSTSPNKKPRSDKGRKRGPYKKKIPGDSPDKGKRSGQGAGKKTKR